MSSVSETVSASAPVRDAVVDNWNSGLYKKLPIGTRRDTRANLLKPFALKTAVFQVLFLSQNARSQMRLRCSIVVPASAALHHAMLNAVDRRKAKEMVIIGARMARMTEGRVFHAVVGFPSERYTTRAAPADEAKMQKIASKVGHCACLPEGGELCAVPLDSLVMPWTDTFGFLCSIDGD